MSLIKLLIFPALLCFAFLANGQHEYFDSIIVESKAFKDDSSAVYFIINSAKKQIYKDRSVADTLLDAALDRATQSGNKDLQAHVNTTQGQLALIDGRYEDAIIEIQKSNRLLGSKRSETYDYLVNLNILGLVEYYQGDYKKALPHFFERLEIGTQRKDHAIQLRTLNNIGICYENISDNDNALKYYNQALQITEGNSFEELKLSNEGQRQYYRASINSNIGVIHLNEKEYDQSKKNTKIAYAVAKDIDNKPLWCDAAVNLSKIYLLENILDTAEMFIEEAVSLSGEINEPARTITAKINQAVLFNRTNRSREAIKVLHTLEQLSDERNIKEQTGPILEELSRAYHQIGDGDRAYLYSKRLLSHRDSVYSKQSLEISKELNQKYETAKKEKEITLQQVLIEKQKHRIILFSVSIVALIMALFYFWSRNRTKQKLTQNLLALKESQIENLNQEKNLIALDYMLQGQEEERKRIAQDLHDGLGGLLAGVRRQIVSIQNQITALSEIDLTQDAERLITKACDEVRRISHEMMPASLISLGLIEAIEDDIAESQNTNGLQITFESNHDFQNINDKTKVNLYRIIQEIINNTLKHAQASSLDILLTQEEGSIQLICKDNGVGFDPGETSSEGFGLKGIQARVNYMKGDFSLESQHKEGCQIKVRLKI